MIEIELPYPPSINHYYKLWRSRAVISREGRAFRDKVCAILARLGVQRISGPLAVSIEVYPPDNRRRDLDNVQKSLLDALQHGGAYDDDSQIVRLLAEKRGRAPGGRVVVRIESFVT